MNKQSVQAFNSVAELFRHWDRYGCEGEHDSDVCTCRYSVPCSRCQDVQVVGGEDIYMLANTGGLCPLCIANDEEIPFALNVVRAFLLWLPNSYHVTFTPAVKGGHDTSIEPSFFAVVEQLSAEFAAHFQNALAPSYKTPAPASDSRSEIYQKIVAALGTFYQRTWQQPRYILVGREEMGQIRSQYFITGGPDAFRFTVDGDPTDPNDEGWSVTVLPVDVQSWLEVV